MGPVRLAWKLQRWELATLIAFVVVLAVALVVIGWRMEQIQASAPACFGEGHGPAGSEQGECEASFRAYSELQQIGPYAAVVSTLAPFVLGMILGPPFLGREIEGRTAGIAWTLSGSRARWLGLRAVPIVIFVLAAMAVIGVSGMTLAGQLAGGEPGFESLVTPIPLGLARGAAALAIGLLAGAFIGRTFPAVLATAFALLALMVATSAGMDAWMAAEARPMVQGSEMDTGSKIYETGLLDDATGEIVTFTQYYARPRVDDTAEIPPPGMRLVAWQIPGSDYPTLMARETATFIGLTLIASTAFVVAVLRRSPHF